MRGRPPSVVVKDPGLLEEDYRAGVLTCSQVAKKHGIERAWLYYHAKKQGWKRDLTRKVRQYTRRKVTLATEAEEKEIPRQMSEYSEEKQEEIADRVSDDVTKVILDQRKDIRTLMSLTMEIAKELRPQPGEEMDTPTQRATATNALSASYGRMVPLYRQTYNMDEPINDKQTEQFEDMTEDELKRFILECVG